MDLYWLPFKGGATQHSFIHAALIMHAFYLEPVWPNNERNATPTDVRMICTGDLSMISELASVSGAQHSLISELF